MEGTDSTLFYWIWEIKYAIFYLYPSLFHQSCPSQAQKTDIHFLHLLLLSLIVYKASRGPLALKIKKEKNPNTPVCELKTGVKQVN